VEKQIVRDLNTVPLQETYVVPTLQIVHDRPSLEVMRGCVKGCRFCQAGYVYRPLRERDPTQVVERTTELMRRTGYEEVSLLSLSTGDYSGVNPVLTELMDRLSPERVAVSLPSTRVDALSPRLLEEIRRVRKTGFTLAPEAGTQRLRDVIQKEYREEELLAAARLFADLGWRTLKLYFMIGLPSETEEDVRGIADLSAKVAAAAHGRLKVTASVSTFVPKPHTPFQWAGQLGLEETRVRIAVKYLGEHKGREYAGTIEGERIKEELGALKERLRVQVKPKVRHGPVVEEIMAEAEIGGYDLIVVGAHHGTGWQRFLLENLASRIIAASRKPVLVLPGSRLYS